MEAKVIFECDVCHGDNYIMLGCCSGRECGCYGQPVDNQPCPKCNPDGEKEPSEELIESWPWFFGMNDTPEKADENN